jgi:hypothetical protein
MKTTHHHRDGETLVTVTVETQQAEIDFEDISDAVKVEPDEGMSEVPWENCCGFDHELRLPRTDCETDSEACIHHDGRYRVFEVPYDTDLYEWHRKHGASRQVAREAVAQSRQRTIDTLKQWYGSGWEWWVTSCDYLGASASVGGVDDYDYASGDCATDIAEEVAAELQKQGFTVTGMPDRRAAYLENRRHHLQQNLLIGTWR